MGLQVAFLCDSEGAEYESLVRRDPNRLLYQSDRYRRLLKHHLDAEDRYFLVREGGELVGALPAFIARHPIYGSVLNSLPFYGSHGGLIVPSGRDDVRRLLLHHFREFQEQEDCVSVTVVTSPWEADRQDYLRELNPNCTDQRIGQITEMPNHIGESQEALMRSFDAARRNNIRKAQKSGVLVSDEDAQWALEFIARVHEDNITAVGGLVKPRRFFDSIPRFFEYGTDYRVYIASREAEPIAGLLCFMYGSTVEYFTPVAVYEHRTYHATSLIIFEAMQQAIRNGFRRWNWGGTWPSQDGVYRFKSQFDASDFEYDYYISLRRDISYFSDIGRSKLLEAFRNFYVIPFHMLETR